MYNFFNPSVQATCDKHGETDHIETYLDGAVYTVCVKCLNAEQLRVFKAQAEAMRASGVVKVEEVTFVAREIKNVKT